MSRVWLVLAVAASVRAQQITSVGNLVHIVADLDRSFELYRNGLGLEVVTPPSPFEANSAINELGDTPGAQMRTAQLRVPGSRLGIELIEYKGIDRQAAHPRPQDPGAGILPMEVKDIRQTTQRALSAGWRTVIGNPAGLLLQDNDGFFVDLTQAHTPRTTTGILTYPTVPPRPVMPARTEDDAPGGFRFTVGDLDQTISAYYEATGLPATGTHKGQLRVGATTITFVGFKTAGRMPLYTRPQDPGTSILQLNVQGLDALLAQMKEAGFAVITTRGQPVSVAGARMVLVRDLNNLFLELIEQPLV